MRPDGPRRYSISQIELLKRTSRLFHEGSEERTDIGLILLGRTKKIVKNDDVFIVEKVLRTRRRDGKTVYFVC